MYPSRGNIDDRESARHLHFLAVEIHFSFLFLFFLTRSAFWIRTKTKTKKQRHLAPMRGEIERRETVRHVQLLAGARYFYFGWKGLMQLGNDTAKTK